MKESMSLVIIIIFAMAINQAFSDQKPVIGVQPFDGVDTTLLRVVYAGIDSVFDVFVAFMPVAAAPQDAYYEPRQRYRADRILDYLESHCDESITKIIGFTDHDISTTKGEHKDWGVFGLGSLGGRACVISTYRLGRNKVAARKFHDRIIKVVNHELGHTFGLGHCVTVRCLMEDAAGSIGTVDNERGSFCPQCMGHLRFLIRGYEEP